MGCTYRQLHLSSSCNRRAEVPSWYRSGQTHLPPRQRAGKSGLGDWHRGHGSRAAGRTSSSLVDGPDGHTAPRWGSRAIADRRDTAARRREGRPNAQACRHPLSACAPAEHRAMHGPSSGPHRLGHSRPMAGALHTGATPRLRPTWSFPSYDDHHQRQHLENDDNHNVRVALRQQRQERSWRPRWTAGRRLGRFRRPRREGRRPQPWRPAKGWRRGKG